MPRRPRHAPPTPLRPPALTAAVAAALAATVLALPRPAAAAAAADMAEPVDRAASAPVVKPRLPVVTESLDPMTRLKRRLESKLGATRAPDAVGTHELRVASPAPPRKGAAKPAASSDDARLRALVEAHRAQAAVPRWGYDGPGGPAHWATLKPDYAQCGSRSRQSPIDIRDGIAVDLPPVRFDYRAGGFTVLDNGATIQALVPAGNSIEVTAQRYELQHVEFHHPSEERVNGRAFDMSAHLVHKAPDGRLAIVAVLLERGAAQPVFQQVLNNLPLEKGVHVPGAVPISPADLLPEDRRYYTYMGSLTAPPCTEGVLWIVLQQPVPVSAEQVNIFARLYPMNARPVQPAGGRLIKQSR